MAVVLVVVEIRRCSSLFARLRWFVVGCSLLVVGCSIEVCCLGCCC